VEEIRFASHFAERALLVVTGQFECANAEYITRSRSLRVDGAVPLLLRNRLYSTSGIIMRDIQRAARYAPCVEALANNDDNGPDSDVSSRSRRTKEILAELRGTILPLHSRSQGGCQEHAKIISFKLTR